MRAVEAVEEVTTVVEEVMIVVAEEDFEAAAAAAGMAAPLLRRGCRPTWMPSLASTPRTLRFSSMSSASGASVC
jgi:hypothetical protein